jgi:prepilin-type N-terminal cleavage/methylation domain-containing protein
MMTHRGMPERGMTLVEMMLALLVFSFVMAGALAFLRSQSRSFTLGSERVMMYQNNRFALNELEKDLRTAGAGTVDQQPQLIYVGTGVVAFNANYWTNTAGDVFAVYYNPDAPDSAVQALKQNQKFTLPQTSFGYPDTSYNDGTANSSAETIIFYFALDTSTTRVDDYALFRQVNNLPAELVSRNILATPGLPFFQYYFLSTPVGGGTPSLSVVPTGQLPWMHVNKIHLSPTDTARTDGGAKIDSLRAMRMNFTSTNGRTGSAERLRAVSRLVRLPNAGLANKKSCGDEPKLGVAPVATAVVIGGNPAVQITWGAAIDETTGEKDVERYVLYRRVSNNPDWADPYVEIPSGAAPYQYTDFNIVAGTSYYYGLTAQDCTPTQSSMASSAIVTP